MASYLKLLFWFLFSFVNGENEFRLGQYYQDEMVLQSGGANIWGWGHPHANIQVRFMKFDIFVLKLF